MNKIAMVLGVTGQDGSYLSEHLMNMGYEVHGVLRRSSVITTERIDHIFPADSRGKLHYGDLTGGLDGLIYHIKPDIIFNLAAQSHVAVSFKEPVSTAKINAVGVINLLETVRQAELALSKRIKFYQASSSEMFGKTLPPQNENSYFHPASPYGCAKLFSYWATRTYRDSYGMFAANGILFNHECLTYQMPLIIREDGLIDIKPVGELVLHKTKGQIKQTSLVNNLEVWDKDKFVKVLCATATKNKNRKIRKIVCRAGVVETTADHIWLDENGGEIKCSDLNIGSKLELSSLPYSNSNTVCTKEMAWLLGAMSADGSVIGKKAKFINKDIDLINKVAELWHKVSGGYVTHGIQISGYAGENIHNITLNGCPEMVLWMGNNLYTKGTHNQNKYKKVPKIILNSSIENMEAFLDGYCEGDGTKSLPNKFQYYTTDSPVLALGLRYCINNVSGVDVTYNVYGKHDHIYKGFINSQRNLDIDGHIGHIGHIGMNLKKTQNDVIKIIEKDGEDEWVFDLETESGKFTAGTGLVRIHNSPRRGKNFVTKKVTRSAARIALGLQDKIELGNLDALRDWGHSKDYTRAMIMIMEHHTPEDWVVSTGEYHSVRSFAEKVFKYFNLDFYKYLVVNDDLKRPNEVPALLGDSTKIRTLLGWKPEYTFDMLVKEMCDYDYEQESRNLKV